VPFTDFHPDLRCIARYIPKQVITPVTLPIMRMATGLVGRHTPKDVEVLTLTSGVGVNQASNKFGWACYLGDADPDIAVPARREDLSGLPRACMGVGTLDLFHDEDLAYAARLLAAGVPCQVEVVSVLREAFVPAAA
jgi:acetyl esterase/lipase